MGTKEEHDAERAITAAERAEAAAKTITDAIAALPQTIAEAVKAATPAPAGDPAPHEHEAEEKV